MIWEFFIKKKSSQRENFLFFALALSPYSFFFSSMFKCCRSLEKKMRERENFPPSDRTLLPTESIILKWLMLLYSYMKSNSESMKRKMFFPNVIKLLNFTSVISLTYAHIIPFNIKNHNKFIYSKKTVMNNFY